MMHFTGDRSPAVAALELASKVNFILIDLNSRMDINLASAEAECDNEEVG